MKNTAKILSLLLALVMALGLCACGDSAVPAESASPSTTEANDSAPAVEMRVIVDAAGRELVIPKSIESVVCVGVGALRYTCYVQGQDLVVGVEEYEKEGGMDRMYNYVNYDLFKDLPAIGGNGEPWEEEIIKLNPQVIVMSASASRDPDDIQSKTGIPVVAVGGSDTTLDDKAYETIRILGELYGKEDRADELTAYLHSIKDDLSQRTGDVPDEDKPSAYVCGVSFKGLHGFEGTEANYGPFVLIDANNLADQTGQALAFDCEPEQVLVWDPDVIFVDYNGLDLINEDYAAHPDYYNSLTAVKEGKVYAQISFRSYAANLDTALADAYYAASILYPEQFADVDIEAKIGEIFENILGANPYNDLKEAGYEFTTVTIGG